MASYRLPLLGTYSVLSESTLFHDVMQHSPVRKFIATDSCSLAQIKTYSLPYFFSCFCNILAI